MYKQFLMYYNGILNKKGKTFRELLKDDSFVLFLIIMILLLISLLCLNYTRNTIGVIILMLIVILVVAACSHRDSKRRLNNYDDEARNILENYKVLFEDICKEMKIKNNKEFKKLIDAFDYKIKYGFIEKNNSVKYALISTVSSVVGLLIGKIIDLASTDPNSSLLLTLILLLMPLIIFIIFLLIHMLNKFMEYKLYNELNRDQLIQLRDYAVFIFEKKLIFKH